MANSDKLARAFQRFDASNSEDPNTEHFEGQSYPKELLYAIRMTNKLNSFAPGASEALQLTARCQHLRRWEIPRNSYKMNRSGYLKWRQDLKRFHAKEAGLILKEVGYTEKLIERVSFLIQKKRLKKDPETQTLEDVICLVFLEHYFEPFARKHPEPKVLDILQKTWNKMSKNGRESAKLIPLTAYTRNLISKALKE